MTAVDNSDTVPDVEEVSVTCHVCGAEVTSPYAEVTDINGSWTDRPVCEECVAECDWCSAIEVVEIMERSGESHICRSCVSDYTISCDRCGRLEHVDDYYRVGGGFDDWMSWCRRCGENYSTFCDPCDVYHSDSDSDCSTASGLVNSYGYKPYPEFKHLADDPDRDRGVYMGFELEIECNSGDLIDMARHVDQNLGDIAYMKEDSSLSHGFEIVTHPMTLAYAKSRDWSVFRDLVGMGARSWNTTTCGLHVHVSRAGFTGKAHQYAFILLLMRNRVLSYLIAGRQGNSYASFDRRIREDIPRVLKNGGYMDRYSAVNVMPSTTLEVRMFRGSLKVERVMAALEYVHSAVEYSRSAPKGARANSEYLTAPAFVQWLRARGELYPNLNTYIRNSAEFGYSRDADLRNRFTTTIEMNEEV